MGQIFKLTVLALALSPFLQHLQVVRGGGREWVRLAGCISLQCWGNSIWAIFCAYIFQDVLHVCGPHVRNLEPDFF